MILGFFRSLAEHFEGAGGENSLMAEARPRRDTVVHARETKGMDCLYSRCCTFTLTCIDLGSVSSSTVSSKNPNENKYQALKTGLVD